MAWGCCHAMQRKPFEATRVALLRTKIRASLTQLQQRQLQSHRT